VVPGDRIFIHGSIGDKVRSLETDSSVEVDLVFVVGGLDDGHLGPGGGYISGRVQDGPSGSIVPLQCQLIEGIEGLEVDDGKLDVVEDATSDDDATFPIVPCGGEKSSVRYVPSGVDELARVPRDVVQVDSAVVVTGGDSGVTVVLDSVEHDQLVSSHVDDVGFVHLVGLFTTWG